MTAPYSVEVGARFLAVLDTATADGFNLGASVRAAIAGYRRSTDDPYCPCGGACHHRANPCSLSCLTSGAYPLVFGEIQHEGERALALHGEPPDRTGLQWLAILAEEFGEASKEVTQGEVPPENRPRPEYLARLRKELVQVASVAVRWIRRIDTEALDARDA